MTQFENLELLYNQFFNLADEIRSMIENEEYSSALDKLKYKDVLIEKMAIVKKTVDFTEEDRNKANLIEEKLREREKDNIDFLKKIYNEVGADLKSAKKKVKVNSAYSIHDNKKRGVFFDITE